MKRVTPALVTMLMFGVVGFLVVAFVAKKYLFAAPVEAPTVARRNIPTAIVEIAPGTRITEQHIGVAPIAADRIQPQTLVSKGVILGRIAKQTIKPLSQISTDDLYAPGDGPTIEIAKGMRAVTVQLSNDEDVVDNLIRPGQYVDVHFHPRAVESDERFRKGLVMTLFEGVKIAAVNRSFLPTNSNRSGTTVTFELEEEQANVLLVARDHGEITLAYTPEGKGSGGVAVDSADRAYLEEVLGLAPTPEPEKPFRADHYHGTGMSTMHFQDGRVIGGGFGGGGSGGGGRGYSLYNELRGRSGALDDDTRTSNRGAGDRSDNRPAARELPGNRGA